VRSTCINQQPSFLSSLTKLTYLSLGSNMFSGTLPSSYSKLTNLNQLNVQFNQISGTIVRLADGCSSLARSLALTK